MNVTNFEPLEEMIGYKFNDQSILRKALTHSSYANENKLKKDMCYERLEFLGDAVLELISSDFIYRKYEQFEEGKLSKLRASIVCEQTLYNCAVLFNLEKFIILGKGEDLTGGRNRPSVVSDVFEALIGAIYLDGGITNAKEFVEKFVLNDIEQKQLFYDSKTILQELFQKKFNTIATYKLIEESGPDHNKVFTSAVYLNDEKIATGSGSSKKHSEQTAAYNAILLLGEKERNNKKSK
ncbi:MAG: ribonuclease III [Lachnospiraceae bacterium]|nr:ribonuclease III [Lachnospiraceae bacterium]